MTTKRDGGQTFPKTHGDNGMSLRDWFAGQALAGITSCAQSQAFADALTARVKERGLDSEEQYAAMMAYAVADAMLAERQK